MFFNNRTGRAILWMLALILGGHATTRATTIVYDFSRAPDSSDGATGTFRYDNPGGPSATFTGFTYSPDLFPADQDHTGDDAGLAAGTSSGPASIFFSQPVLFDEVFVLNLFGDFDSRPAGGTKLFAATAQLAGATVYSYDRLTNSATGQGVSGDYLRLAPASPTLIDALSFSRFGDDVMDDLRVESLATSPEPGGVALLLIASAMGGLRGRRRPVGR